MAKDMLTELRSIEEALSNLSGKGSSINMINESKVYDDTIEELENLLKLIHGWLRKYILPVNSSFTLSDGYLLFCEKKTKMMKFQIQDIVDVIKEGMEILESLCLEFKDNPFLPQGKEVIYKFLYVYNNLLNIYENSDDLKVDYDNYFKAINDQKNNALNEEKSKEQKAIENRINEARKYFENLESGILVEEGELSFGNGYEDSVYIGQGSSQKVDPELAKLAKRILNIDITDTATNQPIYYALNKESKPIVINCSADDIESKKYYRYLSDLLMNFIIAMPAKKIRFAGIECDASINASFLSGVLSDYKKIFYNDKFATYVHDLVVPVENPFDKDKKKNIAEKEDEALRLLESLKTILKERSEKYASFAKKKHDDQFGYDNFFQFNKEFPESQDELIVLVVNNYPYGFTREETKLALKHLMSAQSCGIVVILLQDVTKRLYENEENSSKYTLVDDKTYNYINNIDNFSANLVYNDGKVSFGKKRFNRTSSALVDDVKRLVAKSSQFNTEDLFNREEKTSLPTNEKAFRIPVGLSGDATYNFVTSIAGSPHGIVLGGTGSGKTAFLHTLILNGAYHYSPDDLEFYLTDFKSESGSGAFGEFKMGGKMYIPHVKYLAIETSPENVEDMIEMIWQIHHYRSSLITSLGKEDFLEYNNTSQVKSGNKAYPKISRLCFIIDEYAEMIKNARKGYDISSEIARLLKLTRTTGIVIILCGQDDEVLDEGHVKQIERRVLLKNYTIKNKREFIKNDSASELDFFLNAPGKGSLSMDSGKSYTNVNLCFSGAVGSDLMNSLCERIRNKYEEYESTQIIAGDTSIVDVSSDVNLPRIIEETSDKDFNVFIGQGAVSFTPVAMRFACGQEDSNYFLTGGDETVDNAKRSIIMGFLSRSFARDNRPTDIVIYDCFVQALGANRESNCIKEYVNAYPILNKYIKHSNSEYEIAQTILKLEERIRKNIFGEPVLLIVNGANSITNDGEYESNNSTAQVVDEASIREAARKKIMSHPKISMLSSDKIEEFVEQTFRSMMNSVKKEDPQPNISKRQVRDALKNLYSRGHLVNVFVVLAEGSYHAVSDFVNANPYAKKHFLADRIDPEEMPKVYYPSSCGHLMSKKLEIKESKTVTGRVTKTTMPKEVSSKVKFYDYGIEYNKSWWDEFIKKL